MKKFHPNEIILKREDGSYLCNCHGYGFKTLKRKTDHEYKQKQK